MLTPRQLRGPARVLSGAAEACGVSTVNASDENQARRMRLWSLLGRLPERDRPIHVLTQRVEQRQTYTLEHLTLELNGLDPVPAYFVKPVHAIGPLPTVLFNHAHWGQYAVGKRELIETRPDEPGTLCQRPPWGEALAAAGYAALCIDHWCFGERGQPGAGGADYPVVPPTQWSPSQPEHETFKRMLWDGRVMWGMMVHDSVRALDYLCSRDDVDADRIATLGMSMGSTMAWWLAALDERVRVCVDIGCLTDVHTYRQQRGPLTHNFFYFVPDLLRHFSTSDINALIAPRPHLALAGERDDLTPPAGLDIVDAAMQRVYADLGAADAWKLVREDVPHCETPTMRAEAMAWLTCWL